MSNTHIAIDLIGDIHGHAAELEALLAKLGYTRRGGSYGHPQRRVLFLGDYIDRGPRIRETLAIVRGMVEAGSAVALMGNHEYNALCYHTPDGRGGYLRAHTPKNVHQHQETLDAFEGKPAELAEQLAWFMTLPLYYENDQFRAVHACWDADHIATLRSRLVNDRLSDELLHEAANDGALDDAITMTLTGKEIDLPDGVPNPDKEGTDRRELRIRWWVDPVGATFHSIGFPPNAALPASLVPMERFDGRPHYREGQPPVFFGHYWLPHEPEIQRGNICCLDYSVAKGGKLVAYRYDGEQVLSASKLVHV